MGMVEAHHKQSYTHVTLLMYIDLNGTDGTGASLTYSHIRNVHVDTYRIFMYTCTSWQGFIHIQSCICRYIQNGTASESFGTAWYYILYVNHHVSYLVVHSAACESFGTTYEPFSTAPEFSWYCMDLYVSHMLLNVYHDNS